MAQQRLTGRLDRPVDAAYDHILGPAEADITLVEYGSYACPHCRAANEHIARVRDRFGNRLRYVFRHRPLTGSDIARRAAELVELVTEPKRFWKAHLRLMTRSQVLTEDDLRAVAEEWGLAAEDPAGEDAERARARVEADMRSAAASQVSLTPTFFINGRRYDGPWDEASFEDAMLGRLGHRVLSAALDFAGWAPSAGILLFVATLLALALTNSPAGGAFTAFWEQYAGVMAGGGAFRMSLLAWINDGLMTIFFLVVGLEIKRELTVGRLASVRSAALPVCAAIGGMVVPAAIYFGLTGPGPWSAGWGIPMATDTAFAIALIAIMGRRVPIELRIFLTAASIVDDIGAITVMAVFYSGALEWGYLAAAVLVVGALAFLNFSRVYRVAPYAVLGLVLWFCIHAGGLHATLAGVLLALFIPTRRPADLKTLMTQARLIVAAEAEHGGEVLRHGPSLPALRALDAIHDRLESPADRLLRKAGTRSSYVVLPLFAFANAGVGISAGMLTGHGAMAIAIAAGLVIGKPLGLVLASALAVGTGVAVKPAEYSWLQLFGAGALAGIGFTMSLLIAGVAFPAAGDFAAAKVAVLGASVLTASIGVAVLWYAGRGADSGESLP